MKKLWDIYPGKKSLHNGNDYNIITQEAHDREICREFQSSSPVYQNL